MKKRMQCILSKFLAVFTALTMVVPMAVSARTLSGNELQAAAEQARQMDIEPEYELEAGEYTIQNVATGKLLKAYPDTDAILTVDGEAGETGTVFHAIKFMEYDNADVGESYPVASFISKDYNKGIKSDKWVASGYDAMLRMNGDAGIGGWESVVVVPNGDGTVSFMDSRFKKYMTVNANHQVEGRLLDTATAETLTDKEKFIISLNEAPGKIESLSVNSVTRTQTTLDLSWTMPQGIVTGFEVYQKGPGEVVYTKVATLGNVREYQAENLLAGSSYTFQVLAVNRTAQYSTYSNEAGAKTRAGVKPATPAGLGMTRNDNKAVLSWEEAENATHYVVERAVSRYAEYKACTEPTQETTIEVDLTGNVYANYFRVVALNQGAGQADDFQEAEVSEASEPVSLETELFGDHTIILAETDAVEQVDAALEELFVQQNDADAQFKGEQFQVYFKPGDYTNTKCMNLGFYTAFNGLGKTPYDVKLNNVAIPAYLADNNATCNFWRSMENVSIMKTGNAQGKAGYDSWRGDWLNWAVAQAAPLRRIYSQRPVAYDWNYGWASGGYVADCFIDAADGEGNAAGTWSGQQFYTRNSKLTGNAFGTTLNNFFQGVEAPNLPTVENAAALKGGNGYSNWAAPAADQGQQVFTSISTTAKISEKPFLFLDTDGEYKVFVPAVQENTKGISWSENEMGEGEILPLDSFYIAEPDDTAAAINEQLEAGKNIYFTPGTYHAEQPILVNKKDTILLGTGMASIIPDNTTAAMQVADVDGVRVIGLIFDAGHSSSFLLQVGTKGTHTDHSADPTVLQDLFFRVGGTTDVLTKADDALEINSDDVIGDHFWIWRADHGAGVEWYGNESKHGLIVNGDDVTCYALFNEHFQEYHTLWNGENGATYFYQNETCYDPISQQAWMSHGGTVKGYASYKVDNAVEKHYAVGLGVYNVFINTGEARDAKEVQIELENAIEVPNKAGVLVENACVQTFANDDGAMQKINHIVNGCGYDACSGTDKATGEKGQGWSRKFLLYYNNGTAEFGKQPQNNAEKGKFIGTEVVQDVKQPEDEPLLSVEEQKALTQAKNSLTEMVAGSAQLKKEDYESASWEKFQQSLAKANEVLKEAQDQRFVDTARVENAFDELAQAKKNLVAAQKTPDVQNTVENQNPSQEQRPSTAVPVTKLKVTALSHKIAAGKKVALKVTAYPANASDKSVTYKSSNTKYATVNSRGVVTMKKAGAGKTVKITVYAKDGSKKKAVIRIRIMKNAVKKITLTAGRTVKAGKKTTIRVKVAPTKNVNQTVTFTSSNKKYATVNKRGVVTAKKAGAGKTVKITVRATDGSGKKKTIKIKIK